MKAVNLLPEDDRGGTGISAGRAGGGIFVIAGLLAGLALMALLYGLASHQISHDTTEVATLTARTQQAQERAGQLAPYTSFLQMREQRAQAVAALVGSRFDWAEAFHELGRVLPAGKVSLNSIEGTVGQTANTTSASAHPASTTVASATPPGSIPVFKLTGCAVNQAEVALMLQRLRLINGVSEVSLQSSTQSAPAGPGASAGGGGSGGCEGGNPAFTTQITFDALPAVSTPSAGTATAAAASSASASASATSAPASTPNASAPANASTPASTSSSASAGSTSAAGAPQASASSSSEAVR